MRRGQGPKAPGPFSTLIPLSANQLSGQVPLTAERGYGGEGNGRHLACPYPPRKEFAGSVILKETRAVASA
jgi:hypothetical protein